MSQRFTRHVSSIGVLASLALVALAVPHDAAAQTGRLGPSGRLRAGGTFHDNFFQLPADVPGRDVWAQFVEVTFEKPVGPEDTTRTFVRADLMQFASIGVSPGVAGGLRLDDGTNSFDLTGTFDWNRPRFDVGDEVNPANVAGLTASYSYQGLPDVQLTALGHLYRDWLENRSGPGRFDEIGGAVRYRGFGRAFSPEVGYLRGRRATSVESEEYTQQTWFVTVRSSPLPRVYITTRYRNRLREYSIQSPDSRNTGRVDRRHQVTASVDVTLNPRFVWNVSLRFEKALASRTDRSFTTLAMGSGITVAF